MSVATRVQEYSPNQPRDAHGRFASGGGGTNEDAIPSFKTVHELQAWSNEQFKRGTLNLTHMDMDMARASASSYQDFKNDFPDAAKNIEVGTATMAANVLASNEYGAISLNASLAGDSTKMSAMLDKGIKAGILSGAVASHLEYPLTHEYGHVLNDHIDLTHDNAASRWAKAHRDQAYTLSGRAQNDDRELFAEAHALNSIMKGSDRPTLLDIYATFVERHASSAVHESRSIDQLIAAVESALRVRARDRVLAPVRLAYQKRLRAAFLRQGKAFLDRAVKESNVTILWRNNGWRYRLQEAIGLDWERDWELAVHILDGDKREATDEALRNSILHGAAHINKLVAKDKTVLARADYTVPDFDLKNPRAVEYLRAHGADMIQGIDDTAKERMRAIISKGLEDGASSQSIAKDIRAFFSDMAEQRSELIARTETGNAYEFGSNDYAQQLTGSGLDMEKSWSTVGDDKVDEECAANEDAGWIPIGDTFPSGDDTPLAHPNCRCTCLYRVVAAVAANESLLQEYSPDQPRDKGRFASTGASSESHPRVFTGEPVAVSATLSKQEAGRIGEQIAIEHLKSEGYADATAANADQPNFAIDVLADHQAIEVKTGLVSNGTDAQKWRMTIGQPGKAETAFLKSATPDEKAAWNQRKNDAIVARKERALQEISASLGKTVRGRTITTILNPDTKTADIYSFDGFHQSIRWNSAQARAGYVKTVAYD